MTKRYVRTHPDWPYPDYCGFDVKVGEPLEVIEDERERPGIVYARSGGVPLGVFVWDDASILKEQPMHFMAYCDKAGNVERPRL